MSSGSLLRMQRPVLIVIDMLNDFLAGYGSGRRQKLLRSTNELYLAANLGQKPNLRGVAEMVRSSFLLRKKPLGDSASHYTNSAFAIKTTGKTRAATDTSG